MDLKKIFRNNTEPQQEYSGAPTLFEVLRKDIDRTKKRTSERLDGLMNQIFETTEWSGRMRRWLFIGLAAIVWAWAGYQANNPIGPITFNEFISYPLVSLFAPEVFRHVLVFGLAFWLALQLAASYLDDVFELNNPEIAEKYILQASLANRYQQIEIKEGKVSEKSDSTIVKIGGPGLVKVHFDSAALFEKSDGNPTVISSEDGLVALDRFERLRKVVLLRDHIDETKIITRTRDGIPVIADGVRMKYHLNRDESKQGENKVPFPIVRRAVETVVYKESVVKRIDPISYKTAAETPPEKSHTESLDLKSDPIQSKLKDFISQKTLGEFLARISEPEIQQRIEETNSLESEALTLSGETSLTSAGNGDDKPKTPSIKGKFYPRDEITDMIYGSFSHKDKLTTGLELDWIDIGTWELPENAKHIAEQHREAWLLSLENLKNRSPHTMEKIEQTSRMKALRAVVQEIVFTFQTLRLSPNKKDTIFQVLQVYRQKLYSAQEVFRKEAGKAPIPLSRIIRHLDKILQHSRNI